MTEQQFRILGALSQLGKCTMTRLRVNDPSIRGDAWPTLRRMKDDGLVNSFGSANAPVWVITDKGRAALEKELER